ncbi:hypothetical protein [Streptomyces sp. B21-083]|uniref:hypothetical protein n=1 Tax=Streptomyces sp. B21-083 TaxID=3039410 RepID=UPI002FEF3BF6
MIGLARLVDRQRDRILMVLPLSHLLTADGFSHWPPKANSPGPSPPPCAPGSWTSPRNSPTTPEDAS